MSILIGGAWPYANGSLHIGHVASLLPGDVLARYYRAKNEKVFYVSGSDCHGTPISIRAKKEGVTPDIISSKYHEEFKTCFEKLGFSYDAYSKTNDSHHKKEVQTIIKKLYNNGYIYEKDIEQLYCNDCKQFLPDRFVEGICPICGSLARGDQCDECSNILDPVDLKERKCKLCESEPVVQKTKQLFFKLSSFQQLLKTHLDNVKNDWRLNSVNNTERYLKEGLHDRAISRDLPWGVDVPIEGFEDKKIYVWIDAVLGYYSVCKKHEKDWKEFWNEKTSSYYIHGKDNIPFHSIILPSLLNGAGIKQLPTYLISSEYVTLEGKKISTSNNWAVWIKDLLNRYHVDSIRYFFIVNGAERKDADFSFREFINSHNGELLGAYGNLVNRTLVFIKKSYQQKVPKGNLNQNFKEEIENLYKEVGLKIERGNLKNALEQIFDYIRSINKYFDEETPWITIKSNPQQCQDTLYHCLVSIINIANLLHPFLPFSSSKVKDWFHHEGNKWAFINLNSNTHIKDFDLLFHRLDKKLIDEEVEKLKEQRKS